MGRGSQAHDAPRRAQTAGAQATLVRGELVVLTPHRAALWGRTLLIADLHLGKAQALRAQGLRLSSTASDGLITEQLDRLASAVTETLADRVLILGDLLHAPIGIDDRMVILVADRFRSLPGNPRVSCVPGNHDRALDRVRGAWGLEILPAVHREGPFCFTHDPGHAPADPEFVWAGHLHPAVSVPGDSRRLPAFHLSPRLGILPAFSPFTAGMAIPRGEGDRVFAVADGHVIEV